MIRGSVMSSKSDFQKSHKKKRKRGRPSVLESKEDPDLASKATEMRFLGLSWSQIASRLGIGRTTARRLVLAFQKSSGSQTKSDSNSSVPKTDSCHLMAEVGQHFSLSLKEDILEGMPKTFRIFVSLIRKARQTR